MTARTLTRDEAREAGYSGYAQHMTHLPCPRDQDKSIYCASCQGTLGALALSAMQKMAADR